MYPLLLALADATGPFQIDLVGLAVAVVAGIVAFAKLQMTSRDLTRRVERVIRIETKVTRGS